MKSDKGKNSGKKQGKKIAVLSAPTGEDGASHGPWIRFVTLDGKIYTLDFDFGSLCDAEEAFSRAGEPANLLFCLSIATLNLTRLRWLFAAALHAHHPELSYQHAIKLVTPETVYAIANVAFDVFRQRVDLKSAVALGAANLGHMEDGAALASEAAA